MARQGTQSGGTRRGYKQTEIGEIPVEWEVKRLPDVCQFCSGKAHEQYISPDGEFVCVNSKFISTEGQVKKYSTKNFSPAKKNDILMVMSDLPNGRALAKAFIVEEDNKYAVNQRVCSLTPIKDYAKYLFYYLDRNKYFLNFNDGVNQTHLLNPVFYNCPIALPPLAEQTKIADILSGVDAVIRQNSEQVEQLKQTKAGLMQDLLTGRKRVAV